MHTHCRWQKKLCNHFVTKSFGNQQNLWYHQCWYWWLTHLLLYYSTQALIYITYTYLLYTCRQCLQGLLLNVKFSVSLSSAQYSLLLTTSIQFHNISVDTRNIQWNVRNLFWTKPVMRVVNYVMFLSATCRTFLIENQSEQYLLCVHFSNYDSNDQQLLNCKDPVYQGDLGLMFFDFVHYFTNMNFCYYIIDDWNEMYTVYQPGLYM